MCSREQDPPSLDSTAGSRHPHSACGLLLSDDALSDQCWVHISPFAETGMNRSGFVGPLSFPVFPVIGLFESSIQIHD